MPHVAVHMHAGKHHMLLIGIVFVPGVPIRVVVNSTIMTPPPPDVCVTHTNVHTHTTTHNKCVWELPASLLKWPRVVLEDMQTSRGCAHDDHTLYHRNLQELTNEPRA